MATRCAGLRKSSSFPPVCGPCVQPRRRRAARRVALLGDGRPLSPHSCAHVWGFVRLCFGFSVRGILMMHFNKLKR